MIFLIGCFDGVVLIFGFWYIKILDVFIVILVFGFFCLIVFVVSLVFLVFIGICVKKIGYRGVIVFFMLLFLSWFIGMFFMKNFWFMFFFELIGYIVYVVGFIGFISYFGEVILSYLMDIV